MKIAHISDCHLGYRSGKRIDPSTKINLRELDGYNAFLFTIDEIIKQKPDICICSGDIFHSPTPTIKSIRVAQTGLRKLARAKVPFFNIAGNHDCTDTVRDVPSNSVLHFPELDLYSFITPYEKIEHNGLVMHFVSHHAYSSQEKTFEQVKPVENHTNILITHGSCYDSVFGGVLHSEQSPREIVIPEEVMKMNWDLTLLGHIHQRGWIESTDGGATDTAKRKQFYGGSLIRRGFSDKECKLGRGYTLFDFNEETGDFKVSYYTIPQRLQVDKVIFCNQKTPIQIREEIEEILKEIDYTQIPIVRLSLVGLNREQKAQIDWKDFAQYSSQCLTFTHKETSYEELKLEISKGTFSSDIISSFLVYWELAKEKFSEQERDKVGESSLEFLKEGHQRAVEKVT